jgi:DNA-binding GntR family transcriptional regulator
MGHRLLVDVLRDLTARTTLAATLYQSRHDAGQSCAEHGAIVDALEAGDTARARSLMLAHIGNVEQALEVEPVAREADAPARLRATLAPLGVARPPRPMPDGVKSGP